MPQSFKISGSVDGVAVTITWTETDGFDDPTGTVATRIVLKEKVSLTPTGPVYVSAAHPADAALVTALASFDDRNCVLDGGAQNIAEGIHDDLSIPMSASA